MGWHLLILTMATLADGGQSREPPRRDPPPARAQPRPTPPPARPAQGVYFQNCAAARAAGRENIPRGEPGYRPPLDRDNDGIACESR